MTDIVDPATRSRMMSGIRGKDTRPEMLVRKALHARGFRFRLHVKDLPGRPDIVLPKFRAVIFVGYVRKPAQFPVFFFVFLTGRKCNKPRQK